MYFLEVVDDLLRRPVTKCHMDWCFVAPVRDWLRLLQRQAVEHKGLQAAALAWWGPVSIRTGCGCGRKQLAVQEAG